MKAARRGGASLWLCLALAACQLASPGVAGPGGEAPVVLAPGPISRAEQAEALALYRSAEGSFEARRFLEALRTIDELTERFPASDVSGDAVLLGARAELEAGSLERADAAAGRYVSLLAEDDPRAVEARLLQVRAREGDPAAQLDRLLRIRSLGAGGREDIEAAARAAAEALSPDELEAVLGAAPADGDLAAIPQALRAVHLLERGEREAAIALAETVLRRAPPEPERALAATVARGEFPEGRGGVTSFEVATVLPQSGPPALAQFAREIAEGIEVAAATLLGDGYDVSISALDDQADPLLGAQLMAGLDSSGAVSGVIGFLEEGALAAAGQARTRGVPIVSPTARSTEGAGEGVYSLEGPDPSAAAAIARYAASRAFQRVAIILPQSAHAVEEADAFQAEAERFGVPIVGRFAYQEGATFFETEIRGAQNVLRAAEIAALGLGPEDTLRVEMLEPVGIFLPIPPEDVEYLAPQLAHFALDTLAIELVGTSGWTDPRVLGILQPRYTDGVVATAPDGADASFAGRQRFREAYEQHFQRTLISTTPAIGYDATLVLLEGLRGGRVAPGEVTAAIRGLREVEGATGIFSVVDDRVVRRTTVVRIRNRQLQPVSGLRIPEPAAGAPPQAEAAPPEPAPTTDDAPR